MTKTEWSVKAVNLHLFDGAGAAGEGGADASAAETGENGRGAESATEQSAANSIDTEEVVTSAEDDARQQFENYINGDGKAFYQEKVQKIIDKRFAKTKTLEANAKALEPMLRALATNYDIKPNDYKALSEAVLNDQKLYEERARENGVSVDVQMKFDKIQQENEALKAQQEQEEQDARTQQILQKWNDEAEEFKKEVPDFDLEEAFENEEFFDLVVRGYPIKHVYNLTHADEYEARVTAKAEKKITDNIRAKGIRADENGVSQRATAEHKFEIDKLTSAQMRDLINRAQRGEVITF